MDVRFLKARLDNIDAANECIIERQGILAGMLAVGAIHDTAIHGLMKEELNEMDKVLKKYIAAIEKIQKEYEDGSTEAQS